MKSPVEGMPSYWLVYFAVGDTDATVAKARERGGNVMVEPTDIPTVGRFAVLTDPQGAAFGVIRNETPQ
jgi:predicted enzyme related to lactoylglutathione lyase